MICENPCLREFLMSYPAYQVPVYCPEYRDYTEQLFLKKEHGHRKLLSHLESTFSNYAQIEVMLNTLVEKDIQHEEEKRIIQVRI